MASVTPDRQAWRGRFAAYLLLFALVAGLYAATFDFRGLTDTRLNSLQTRALVLHGDVDVARYGGETRGFIVRRGTHSFTIYGVGISLVAAPFYAVLSRVDMPDSTRQGFVAVPFVAAAAIALLHVLLRLVPARIAAAGGVVFAFGTTMWPVAAMALFQHGPVALFQAVGLAGLFSRRGPAPFIAGLGFAAASVVRLSTAVPLALVGVLYLTEGKRKTLLYVAGSILPLTVIAVQNRWIWGSWLSGGYVRFGTEFDGDMPKAAYELLLGPWRGLFVYSPVLVLGLVGFVIALRRPMPFVERRMAFLGMACLATVLLYARKSDWTAGLHQFGYRYLLDVVPFLVVLGAWAWTRRPRLGMVAVPLGVLSIMTMAFGMANNRFAWDGIESPTTFADAPIGEAWIVFLDHPLGSVLRLVGVAAIAAVFVFASERIASGRDVGSPTAVG